MKLSCKQDKKLTGHYPKLDMVSQTGSGVFFQEKKAQKNDSLIVQNDDSFFFTNFFLR